MYNQGMKPKIDVVHLAKLSNLPLSSKLKQKLETGLKQTLIYVSKVSQIETKNIPATHQITKLTNVTRPDVIDTSRQLSQIAALSQAKRTHNGYFVVKAIR